jgi:3-oxoacyl-(acyl-carrier-protein) synthase
LEDPLYIGATKANIGHLEGASGLAGIVKAIMVLEKGIIPPIAQFSKLNEKIDAQSLPLHVCITFFVPSSDSDQSSSHEPLRHGQDQGFAELV